MNTDDRKDLELRVKRLAREVVPGSRGTVLIDWLDDNLCSVQVQGAGAHGARAYGPTSDDALVMMERILVGRLAELDARDQAAE